MRLVCCGLATLDVVQVVDEVPAADQKVVARSVSVTFGGPAANAAATAAALGVPTRLVTALGRSPLAELVRHGLEEAGVEVVDLLDGPGAPAVSTVLVTAATGERAVVSVNATGLAELLPAAPWARDATAVLVDGHLLDAGLELASAARAAGVPVLLDGGSWKPGLERLLAVVDHAVLSADFRAPGSGDPMHAVAELGPSTVAVSAGAGPVRVRAGGAESVLVPPGVDDVVDTLGAGDVLHGAMAAALARGAAPLEALELGIRQASESVRYAGALGWVR
ncbi:PfkB family carbohydrate kinase [Cellulomonas edaphi]|uniref:PfkB family carbohydrate kinase n=1 Tax=Cellulomonas edaphi TaxID=3053468 RepID=A0ABT7SAC6_9CELL|nr:PfkB family carbohydrate kinase [Cellulomons edaphi]MDM7832568.1 PfkB family carbohydrate kinase [Cellulomons edaphi]